MEDMTFGDVDDLSYACEAAEGRTVENLIPIPLKFGALVTAVAGVVPAVTAGWGRAG
jgi:hypothetical protein